MASRSDIGKEFLGVLVAPMIGIAMRSGRRQNTEPQYIWVINSQTMKAKIMNTVFNTTPTSAVATEFDGSCAGFEPNDQPEDNPYYVAYDFFSEELDGKLSDDEVEDVLPVFTDLLPETLPNTMVDNGINWALHASCYLTAWRWFKDIYVQHGDEFASHLFMTLTEVEKAIVQRGFDIFYDDAWPPLLGHEHYVLPLRANRERKSAFDFPVRRVNNDPVQLSSVESNVDAQSSGAFLN